MKVLCKNQFYDGNAVLFECKTKQGIICWLENALMAIAGFSLLSKLNDIQNDCLGDNGETVFPNKFEMPIKIINLVIEKYNLKIKD